ncbi:substrate-binding periplasmic protein [Sphingomonas sp. PAMC 26617]|uniref:substrate-binding periplasmic protein n=1 Tax=Sphingomonas sp. PAMC 26617 TaxID=1112216 RepID=UPI0012F4CC37|nr:transporter substrate-binding domain-containing protein [Sphingomonas sp. PAMC 26617]
MAVLIAMAPTVGKATDVPTPIPGTSTRIDAIRQRGSLRMAVLDEYPWLKRNPNEADAPFEGPAWVLAEEYAKRLGVKLETVEVEFDTKVAVLSSDAVDITVAPLLATPARQRLVDMIEYSVSAQCLFGRADNPKLASASGIDDMNRPDVTVTFITHSPQGDWLQKRLPKTASRGVPGNLADVPVDEIMSGRADVTTIDKYFFAGLAKKTPGLVSLPRGEACLASKELPIPIGMAIAKDQPVFLAWLRAVAVATKPLADAEQAKVELAGS